MGQSFVSSLFHCTFSTKFRRPLIRDEIEERLWKYAHGIARQNRMKALKIGGVEDYLHVLLSIPSTIPISKAMQLIKGGSSKWIHDTFPALRSFGWQEGNGAFSIGVSQVEPTVA